ncbi:Gfo/Idh/MocA family protein [Halomicroarcula sp. GCM10025817]|uniref:Gfo/Idh/MocA family protein n=1 Tax=Haloarcula TaxID=2237 RepID=UPI0023E8DDF1|nr:Gfo/Idh/MocA family oxidoreductase [Halomicroarcula sp. SYNS111]
MTDPSSVSLGIVGLGNIARIHCDALESQGLGDVVTAGVDVDADARAAFETEYDVSVSADPEPVFEAVDAVMVTTPNRYHEEYVVAALEAGLDVLVQKPLADDLAGAERIAAAARSAPGFCMVGFHNRFASPVRTLAAYRERGTLGTVSHVEANYVRRRGIPNRGSWFTQADVAGGGSLIDIGVHAIDLSLSLLGDPDVVEVSGTTRSEFGSRPDYGNVRAWRADEGEGGFDVDDSASAFVRCANGATISLEVAWATNRPDSKEYYVRGDAGGARLDLGDGSLTLYETADVGGIHHRTTDVETAPNDPHAVEARRFVEAVAAGESPAVNTVEQALTVQRVVDGIYRSSEAGAAVGIE